MQDTAKQALKGKQKSVAGGLGEVAGDQAPGKQKGHLVLLCQGSFPVG